MKNYMYIKNNKKCKKIIVFSFIIAFFIFLSLVPLALNFILPKEINLIAGNNHKIQFKLPIMAKINEDASVFSVNNKPLSSNENIKLSEPIYLKTDYEGSHKMTLSLMGIPIKNITVSVLPNEYIIPCGVSVGVRINTDGVMVLALGNVKAKDGKEYAPAQNLLKTGDMILEVNSIPIDSKETLISAIESSQNLNMKIRRKEEEIQLNIKTIEGEDGKNKIGAWVRDSTQGIGTLTYLKNDTKEFGALGHGIIDIDTKQIMKVKDGKIMKAEIGGIKKSEKGAPGELLGQIKNRASLGEIEKNTDVGIYGKVNNINFLKNKKPLPIGLKNDVKLGKAKILSNINSDEVEEFEIEIESINKYNMDSSKSMVIRITDEKLLAKTNGIVQGMSGSPIIQDGKVIGAVTHVFVNEPSKGYGIFIENMLKN